MRTSQTFRAMSALALALLAILATFGSESRELRGRSVPSKDGQTYLVVDDDNGGKCGPLLVDEKPWPHPIHTPGTITPGRHRIECGGWAEFNVEPATTFHFDYWGP